MDDYVPMGREAFERSMDEAIGQLIVLLLKLNGPGVRLFRDDFIEIDYRGEEFIVKSNLLHLGREGDVVDYSVRDKEFQVVMVSDRNGTSLMKPGEWIFHLYRAMDSLREKQKEREILKELKAYYTDK